MLGLAGREASLSLCVVFGATSVGFSHGDPQKETPRVSLNINVALPSSFGHHGVLKRGGGGAGCDPDQRRRNREHTWEFGSVS